MEKSVITADFPDLRGENLSDFAVFVSAEIFSNFAENFSKFAENFSKFAESFSNFAENFSNLIPASLEPQGFPGF